jgi:hypothetical protein
VFDQGLLGLGAAQLLLFHLGDDFYGSLVLVHGPPSITGGATVFTSFLRGPRNEKRPPDQN